MRPLILKGFIERRIYLLRGQKVMLGRDLAALYGVPAGALGQAVKRHINRFPADFMFQLNQRETLNWKSQTVISNPSLKMGIRTRPFAFTELGVAMLSSVLNSERAVEVNIEIMRTFVRLKRLVATNQGLARKLADLEKRHEGKFRLVFAAIRRLMELPPEPRKQIGFRP